MAWTKSMVGNHNEGNVRTVTYKLTCDSAEQNVSTALAVIDYFTIGACSLATGAPHVYANSLSTGTASAGNLGCSGFVSGDVFFVTVYGR